MKMPSGIVPNTEGRTFSYLCPIKLGEGVLPVAIGMRGWLRTNPHHLNRIIPA